MQEERFWMLASASLAGEASPEEITELEEMLRQHPEWAVKLEIMRNIWRAGQEESPARKKEAFDRHLQRFSAHLSAPALQYDQPESSEALRISSDQPIEPGEYPIDRPDEDVIGSRMKGRYVRLIWGALAAAVLGGIVFLLFPFTGRKDDLRNPLANTVSTRPGSRSRIQLPDGTQVWLNADSRITYNASFTGPSREVQLAGEAYFDVAKDRDHPFIVHTPAVDVRVLGTSFDVRSYSNEPNTEAALFRGSVEVTLLNNPDKKIVLKPNEKLTVRNDEATLTTGQSPDPGSNGLGDGKEAPMITLGKVHFQKKDSSITEALWIRNQLAFDGTTLDEAARQIERWYGVRVTIMDERLKRTAYSAVFEDETLAQVMDALRLSGNFHYTIHKKDVRITR